MSCERTIVPGQIEGFLAGCPFCTAKRKGVPEVGTRFRIISGSHTGRTGTVVKVPEKYSLDPYEIYSHLDGDKPNLQVRTLINHDLVQVLPAPPTPKWAPPLSMKNSAILDDVIAHYCKKNFSCIKSNLDLNAFNEVIRTIWQNRFPLQPNELLLVLKAHGFPGKFDKEVLAGYENGINLLIYANGKKPIKKYRVTPLSF